MPSACNETAIAAALWARAVPLERSETRVRAVENQGIHSGGVQRVSALDRPEASSEQLAEKTQRGCRDAFERLVERHGQRIFSFLYQLTRNPHDAEDLAQETFLKAFQDIHRYNPAYRFATWLFTIAKRTAASHFRSMRSSEELPEETEAVDADPSVALQEKEERSSLWQLARKLKPNQYEALWLRYGEGFSVAETARIMNTNQIHVKVLLHRARKGLGELLEARASDDRCHRDL